MSKLSRMIEDALAAMRQHPQHDLTLGYRYAIKATFSPRYYPANASVKSRVGHQKRTLLAIKTVQHVLPLWERFFPENETPSLLLAQAHKVLKKEYSIEQAIKDVGEAWTYMDSFRVHLTRPAQAVAFVGCAAVVALTIAVEDEPIDAPHVKLDLTDADVDAYEGDGAFEACLAYTGGPPWHPESSAEKRREFWEWWLLQAVPSVAGESSLHP